MGEFFGEVFLPAMKKLVEAGLSYDEVKGLVKIPSNWGAVYEGENQDAGEVILSRTIDR
jgi:hypothetical protein